MPSFCIWVINSKNIDLLGENRIDKARSSKSDNINQAYTLALATLREDI